MPLVLEIADHCLLYQSLLGDSWKEHKTFQPFSGVFFHVSNIVIMFSREFSAPWNFWKPVFFLKVCAPSVYLFVCRLIAQAPSALVLINFCVVSSPSLKNQSYFVRKWCLTFLRLLRNKLSIIVWCIAFLRNRKHISMHFFKNWRWNKVFLKFKFNILLLASSVETF